MNKLRKIILMICVFGLIASLSGLAVYEIGLRQQREKAEELAAAAAAEAEAVAAASEGAAEDAAGAETAPDAAGDGSEESAAGESEEAGTEPDYVSPIDFDTLWEENEDIYAWIRIEDTVIDYPVVQSDPENPDYYLMRNIDGSSGYPGALFSESDLNEEPLEDNVTVIYGHNMKDGTMFGSLTKWEDDTYRDEHRTIEIFTPDREYIYTIAFVQLYDNRNILYNYNCNTKIGYELFLDSLSSSKMIPYWHADDIELTAEQKLVILSTCSGNNRLLVGGVLTEDDEPGIQTSNGESDETAGEQED